MMPRQNRNEQNDSLSDRNMSIYSGQDQPVMRGRQQNRQNIKYEKAHDQYQCQQMLKDALDNMKHQGYNFCYSSMQKFDRNIRKRQMVRNSIYLRFKCSKCKQKQRNKRFTSTMGTVSIKFQFKDLTDKRYKYKKLLIFNMEIYRMKCLNCGKYGQAEIYDSQLEYIQIQFCRIVGEILDGVIPRTNRRNKQPKKVPDLKHHKHFQCEACWLKKCHKSSCPVFS